MKTEAIRYCIQAQFGKEDYAEARLELTALETKINRLTTFNESMQTDARKNTATINKQAAEIETLKGHLLAIETITALSDYEMSFKSFKAIRAHTLAAGGES